MSHRDFDAARAERLREIQPATFTMGGRRFSTVAEPALGDALALADAPEPDQSPTAALVALLRFIESVVEPGQRRAFRRMAKRARWLRWRRRPPVSSHEVFELGAWLAVVMTGRPTHPSSVSSDGRPPTGGNSNSTASPEPASGSATSG